MLSSVSISSDPRVLSIIPVNADTHGDHSGITYLVFIADSAKVYPGGYDILSIWELPRLYSGDKVVVWRQRLMRKRFPLLAILLLSLWPACGWDNHTARLEIVSTEAESSAVPVVSAVFSGGVGSSSQAIELKNPTFQELRDFILRDPTNRSEFILNQYECRHFATEVNNNAEAEGLRCGFALVCFEQGQHSVVAFDTTDRGLVYIEPQTDAAIHPEVSGKYQGKEIKEILIAW